MPTSSWLDRIAGHRVVVIGDPVLDVYLNGFTDRVSREAPVLIVREESTDHRLGGAANAAANLASLGARVTLVGFVGEDPDAEALADLVAAAGIQGALVPRAGGRTVSKTRVMAGGLHIRKQQMLRVDRENRSPPAPTCVDRLRRAASAALASADALVVSDYGDAAQTGVYADLAAMARADGRTVVVDSRHALLRFEGASAVTPNQPEVEALLGRPLLTADETLAAAGWLVERLGLDAAVITRGREGLVVAARDAPGVTIPAVGGDAVDVTGAGDTVTAAFTLALLAGARPVEAARFANQAAAVTVQQVGAAVCTLDAIVSRPAPR